MLVEFSESINIETKEFDGFLSLPQYRAGGGSFRSVLAEVRRPVCLCKGMLMADEKNEISRFNS